jgi:hypothetical protein
MSTDGCSWLGVKGSQVHILSARQRNRRSEAGRPDSGGPFSALLTPGQGVHRGSYGPPSKPQASGSGSPTTKPAIRSHRRSVPQLHGLLPVLWNRTHSVALCILLHARFTPAQDRWVLMARSRGYTDVLDAPDWAILGTYLGAVLVLIAVTGDGPGRLRRRADRCAGGHRGASPVPSAGAPAPVAAG